MNINLKIFLKLFFILVISSFLCNFAFAQIEPDLPQEAGDPASYDGPSSTLFDGGGDNNNAPMNNPSGNDAADSNANNPQVSDSPPDYSNQTGGSDQTGGGNQTGGGDYSLENLANGGVSDSTNPAYSNDTGTGANTNTGGSGNNTNTASNNSGVFDTGGGNGGSTQNPGSPSGSSNGNPASTGGSGLSGFLGGSAANNNDLINEFGKNEEWTLATVARVEDNLRLTTELANQGIKEINEGFPKADRLPIKPIEREPVSDEALQMSQKALDKLMEKDIKDRYNAVVNETGWPRTTFEPINLESTNNFDSACHLPYRDVFSSDQREQYKYFSSPLVSLSKQLMDFPRVDAELEQRRKTFCQGTSCEGGGGSGSAVKAGVLKCFKNNKALGSTLANMIDPVTILLKGNIDPALEFVKQQKLEVLLGIAGEPDTSLCMDFTGNKFPWSAASSKFFSSYRHLAALQQGLDASEYFQKLTKVGSPAALPIGHTISDNDRFFGLKGNFALEVASDPNFCPTVNDITNFMRTNNQGRPQGALAFKQANAIDMPTSEYQAFTRYPVFKCGGGRFWRGSTLFVDGSQSLCQKGRVQSYVGKSPFPFWHVEIPKRRTVVPIWETKVC